MTNTKAGLDLTKFLSIHQSQIPEVEFNVWSWEQCDFMVSELQSPALHYWAVPESPPCDSKSFKDIIPLLGLWTRFLILKAREIHLPHSPQHFFAHFEVCGFFKGRLLLKSFKVFKLLCNSISSWKLIGVFKSQSFIPCSCFFFQCNTYKWIVSQNYPCLNCIY